MPRDVDVVVVGGGPAGLGAATALARSLRSVVVVDAGEPRNAPAAGAHNVLGQEGRPPREIVAAGRREAEGYGVVLVDGTAVDARRADGRFEVDLADGTTLRSRRLVLATGLVDELPDVPGLREHWGHRVLHCPYCHGYEVRGLRVGVLATSPAALHQVLLFRQLSQDVTLFRHTADDLDDAAWEQLAALDVQVVEGEVREVVGSDDGLTVVLDGTRRSVDALVVAPRFRSRPELYTALGGTMSEQPFGALIPTEPGGRTAVDGVWAAGNASNLMAMVSVSSGEGVGVGAQVNADLAIEDAERAVRERRAVSR
ncbi:NAD(P)/FAD-dependent oxidoreductase [Cellulosimicrobium arenosum]|uniref:NAD(P)/FAD-dependent oxidoreductase n=1 Tax=Cellulosimicrobium arenosum TaxID=2708133 RepID=A0A927G8B2_9MICO|nr:NAD(P)/FAD-dependent oxidoreductase [Cellulosimicrobium arenosum]